MKKQNTIKCTVEFTEGAAERITDAFVDLFYQIERGIYKGPLIPREEIKETQEETA